MCFFGKKFVGLDIADTSIEVALVGKPWGQTKVLSVGRLELENGIVKNGKIVDKEKLGLAIKQVMNEAAPRPIKSKDICFGLSEGQTFLHNIYINAVDRKEKQRIIDEEIAENIPLNKGDLAYSFRVLNESKEKTELLIVATRQTVLNEWKDFFKSINLDVVSFDIEILATFRNLFDNLSKEPVMLLDIGANTTYVAIFDEFGLRYEYIVNIAGNDFSETFADVLGLTFQEAEVEKIKSGLRSSNSKVLEILQGQLDKILFSIDTSILNFKDKTNKEVKKVFLVGGSSLLIGLPEYFSKSLGISAEVGNSRLTKEELPLVYIEAIGLAMRKIEKRWDKTDPNF